VVVDGRVGGWVEVFEGGAGELEAARFVGEGCDAVGGWGVVEALGADVGDAVAFGVGASGSGRPGEVGSEGVGGAEAGALADEEEGEVGVEGLADGVGDGDAGLLGDDDRGEAPAWRGASRRGRAWRSTARAERPSARMMVRVFGGLVEESRTRAVCASRKGPLMR
jgi:hypothetical protein